MNLPAAASPWSSRPAILDEAAKKHSLAHCCSNLKARLAHFCATCPTRRARAAAAAAGTIGGHQHGRGHPHGQHPPPQGHPRASPPFAEPTFSLVRNLLGRRAYVIMGARLFWAVVGFSVAWYVNWEMDVMRECRERQRQRTQSDAMLVPGCVNRRGWPWGDHSQGQADGTEVDSARGRGWWKERWRARGAVAAQDLGADDDIPLTSAEAKELSSSLDQLRFKIDALRQIHKERHFRRSSLTSNKNPPQTPAQVQSTSLKVPSRSVPSTATAPAEQLAQPPVPPMITSTESQPIPTLEKDSWSGMQYPYRQGPSRRDRQSMLLPRSFSPNAQSTSASASGVVPGSSSPGAAPGAPFSITIASRSSPASPSSSSSASRSSSP